MDWLFQFINSEPATPMIPTQPTQHSVFVGKTFSHRLKVWTQNPTATASFQLLSTPPSGMTVDASGLVSWVPAVAQIGTHQVTARVTSTQGIVEQTFVVTVLDDRISSADLSAAV